jgi:hypothetical protein
VDATDLGRHVNYRLPSWSEFGIVSDGGRTYGFAYVDFGPGLTLAQCGLEFAERTARKAARPRAKMEIRRFRVLR